MIHALISSFSRRCLVLGGACLLAVSVRSQEAAPLPVQDPVVSRTLTENDAQGRALRITFLDKDLKPTTTGTLSAFVEKVTLGAQGFSSIKFAYGGQAADEIPISWEFFDSEGKPVVTSQGFSKIEIKLDDDGRLIECDYLGPDGALVNNRAGFAILKRTYDGTNNLVKEAYFDKENKASMNNNLGYASMNISYIKNDKEEYEERSFEDTQGNAIKVDGAYKHVQGIAKGSDPMTIVQSYNNLDDTLMPGPRGYALHVTRTIDSEKNPKEAYLNEKSELVNGPEGFAQLVHSIDEKTGEEKLQYQNAAGQPVTNPRLKWATMLFKRDDKGQVAESRYFDKDGQQVQGAEKPDPSM